MAADVEIPRYLLSAFINREYGMGFREFLNRYRVQYFLDNLHTPSWSNLTLEAIAWQCGFNSRSTFINHSKKMTGKTPSEFMKVKPRNWSAFWYFLINTRLYWINTIQVKLRQTWTEEAQKGSKLPVYNTTLPLHHHFPLRSDPNCYKKQDKKWNQIFY